MIYNINIVNDSVGITAPDVVGGGGTPPVPPRRNHRNHRTRALTPPRPNTNGLPPTPKVHMGACFSKV